MKSLLKPLSILQIILGVLSLIGAVLVFIGGNYINSIAQTGNETELGALFIASGIIALVSGLFNFACGLCGLKGANGNAKKLNTAIKLGWVGFVMAILSLAMTFIGNKSLTVNTAISSIASAVIPVLFLLSAKATKDN